MKKVFILSAITVLSLFTLVTQIASSQTSSSQNLNIVGAPQTGIDNTESEKTASAKAQEIAFEYLKCFVQKSFPAKDPLEIESGDLVACIISTNKDLSLSFNNDVVELTVAENAVFCNNLPIFTSTTQTEKEDKRDTTPAATEEEETTEKQSTAISTSDQRASEQSEADSADIVSQLNSLVANPLFETGYQKLHTCLGVEIDSIGFITKAESRTPGERDRERIISSSRSGDENDNNNNGDGNSRNDPTPDTRSFGFGIYNQDGNNYDIIVKKSETECLNYFSIAGEVTPEIEAFCSENIVKSDNRNRGLFPPSPTQEQDDGGDEKPKTEEEEDARNDVLGKLGFSRQQEVSFNESVDNLKISIASGIVFCAAIIGVENLFNIQTGITAVASSDSANRILPCIINPLTEALREQIIKQVFQEYINFANSGFDGASLRFDNFADFTNAALDDTADAYLGTISQSVFGGCGINFPGLYIVLSAPEVSVARPNCSALDFERNSYENRDRTVDEWVDQIENPGKYSLGIQITFFEDLKEAAIKKSTSFIGSTKDSGRIPKSKDKDCVKKLIRERKVQITNDATAVDNNREYLDDDKAEKAEQGYRDKGKGAIISIAEAKSECGIDTNPDELKRLEETSEKASFDELLSKDELRDLIGKAVGATITGQIRRHIKHARGEGGDNSGGVRKGGSGGGGDDTYDYVGESSNDRILNAYNSSLKALWQQNLDASEFTTLINFLELQEHIARLYFQYFQLGSSCWYRKYISEVSPDNDCYSDAVVHLHSEGAHKVNRYGSYYNSTWYSSYSVDNRKEIPPQYGKAKFKNRDFVLQPLSSAINGDFDISTNTLVGNTAHDVRSYHDTILDSLAFLSTTTKEVNQQALTIASANANLVLTLKKGPISLINQALEDTFGVLKHQRTAAQQFGASTEFREWLRNKDGVKKTRVFIAQSSLYGANRNERFFTGSRFKAASGKIDSTFASDDTIDTLASYSDDRSSCSFYKDSAIDINANDLITGQATGTEIYIPTDCAVGHIINWIKTEKAADDIVNFNTYMANIVPKLFAAYKEIFVNTYDIKIYKANTFSPSQKNGYHRGGTQILKQFVDAANLLGIYINPNTTDNKYKNIYTKEKLDNIQKAVTNRIKTILNESVIKSL